MATKLFTNTHPTLTAASTADTHRGTNSANAAGTATWWFPYLLDPFQGLASGGFGILDAATVNGPTNGIEIRNGSVSGSPPCEWISPPLAANITISGTITFNVWMLENSMSANAGAQVIVERLDSQGNIVSTVTNSEKAVELGTALAVQNWTATPTSTTFNRGDRIRVRVLINDAGGTMVTGFTSSLQTNGLAGGTGDSYVQFTENLTFEPAGDPGQSVLDQQDHSTSTTIFGSSSGSGQQAAQSFIATSSTLTEVRAWLSNGFAAADNAIVEIQTDSAGSPSGTVVANVATAPGSSIGATTQLIWPVSISLTQGATYWLVFRRSGVLSAGNPYSLYTSTGLPSGWVAVKGYNGSAWVAGTGLAGAIRVTFAAPVSTYYLTNTAETINPGAAIEKKALTTPGSGSVTAITNTAAGPVTPIQVTATGGGTAIEWYTPALNAFTLAGKAKLNLRALESSASANASLKAEIAVCAGDGTGAVVWGVANVEAITTNGNVGELNTVDTAQFAWVEGPSTSVTQGQRLRIRVFVDDCGDTPLVTAFNATVSYNGPTSAAAGDTFVILPVVVTEASTGAAHSLVAPMRREQYNRLTRWY